MHLLLYNLAQNPDAWDRLFDVSAAGRGIFRDHLHRYLMQFQREPELAEAMKSVIRGRCCKDLKLKSRLEAAGLIRMDEQQNVLPLCRLYDEFFKRELG